MALTSKDAVLRYIKNGESFRSKYFDNFRDNREIVIEAIKQSPNAFNYAALTLRDDKALVLEAIKQYNCGMHFPSASDELRDDKEVVMTAVKSYGNSLCAASERLKNDKEVVLEAVKQQGCSIYYASDELKNDVYVVLEAVRHNTSALKYAGDEIQREVMKLEQHNPVKALEELIIRKTQQYLEEKITPSVNLKSLSDLREEQGLTRKNKI